ncbi:hypothetical protein SS50377_28074 [Spironucleus salmonicida]|uniref:Uncharacterized protein n=1 Tax=Spironucleus salmonicida TaxID=348837 RepID=V6LFZ8_9EUKA|nr:hypothetical protein SS50377_28074 [Spironucleus salmonicida]|eukprot:EST42626.1 Hypothetical protein SS50377_17945 [Spironucleus salmonicida]
MQTPIKLPQLTTRQVPQSNTYSLIEQRRQFNMEKKRMYIIKEYSQQFLGRIGENLSSKMVEHQRLAALKVKKNVDNQKIVAFISQTFPMHKKQEKLLKTDTNDEKIIAISTAKYDIISMQVLDARRKQQTKRRRQGNGKQ